MAENENAPDTTANADAEGAHTSDEVADAGSAVASAGGADAGTAATAAATAATAAPEQVPAEEINYHAVEKDGQVTAIWEMQGRKHLRTIDPRSRQGQEILRLYTAEHEQQ